MQLEEVKGGSMSTCKNCTSFKLMWEGDRGTCDMTGDYNNVSDALYADHRATETFRNDAAYGDDWESNQASVIVGINFGCIHFKER